MEHALAIQQKNLKSDRRKIMSLDEHRAQSNTWQTKHDAGWSTKEQKELQAKASKFLTKETWKKIPAPMLENELQHVLPAFWRHCKKSITKTSKFSKKRLLKKATNDDTWKTNLGTFLSLVENISDRKVPNTISTKVRAKALETQKAIKCELLTEFIKPSESQWLAGAELDAEDKLEEMRSIMTSNGTEISSLKRWQLKRAEMDEVKISFRLT